MEYDIFVPSLSVKVTRSREHDTDYASLGAVTIAADGTKLETYGPTTIPLGDLGPSSPYVGLSLKRIDIPDGGSLGIVFTVLNKGTWAGQGTIEKGLDLVCGGIIGALAGGQLAGVTTQAAAGAAAAPIAIPLWEAALAAAGVVAIMDGIDLLLANCDGWVVNGTMQVGRAELDANATRQVWEFGTDYPGSDSPEGCGANSDYSVVYQLAASALEVAVPRIDGKQPREAVTTLQAAGLVPRERREVKTNVEIATVGDQVPAQGTIIARGAPVDYDVLVPNTGSGGGHQTP